ncbi:N-carbamoyl-L-amino-acid hydrolase [Pseudorhizobium tarimense]|uniref:N-carbamoyl-L-amino-acid hydrolase n=1 Tax=Pseudorhizobium tarimense TaxID=1079109 RepID=A0ABV2HE44_9HYPH|nr:Zn-dependent hydrolase [Pseudorhizobium tarimense]MCJ8521774.1 Zn-dependent hydrolase [Pseudorhizobium tarimense]
MVEINGSRLDARLDQFAAIGATPKGGVNRQALTEGDRQARRLLTKLALARGFDVFQDQVANLFIRRRGRYDDLPPLMMGSHLDSQPTGGRFDGALGTLSAFEVLESLEDAGVETERPIVLVSWTNEEGCRFAPGCMGSMAFSNGTIPNEWYDKRATDGASFASELKSTIESLPEARVKALAFPISAYVEVHIEQGPSLEAEGIPVGVVTGIQGTRWLQIAVKGQTAHAGTTGLAYRRDPLWALTSALSQLYQNIMPPDPDARFTVGRISASPGSVNAIPDEVTCTVDIRHPKLERLDEIEKEVISAINCAADRQHCAVDISRTFDMPPCTFDQNLQEVIIAAAGQLDLEWKAMLSGAFHDALFVNRVAPASMIFVPCHKGLSHNEAEYVEPLNALAGCQLLAKAATMMATGEL